jgi:hypothetical protein
MPIPIRRPLVADNPFTAGQISTFRLPKGSPHKKAYLLVTGTVTLTVAGSAVKLRGVPVRQVQLVTDNGVTPHSMVGRDLVILSELMEQTPLAAIYTPPSNFTVAAYNFSCAIPIFFNEPRSGAAAEFFTQLPSWAYVGDALLKVTWGDVTEMFSGTPTGTFSNMSVALALISSDKLGDAALQPDYTSRFWQTFQTNQSVAVVNGGTFTIDVPRTEDTRQLIVVGEDSNGVYSAAVVSSVVVEENNSVQRVAGLTASGLAIETAQLYGVTPAPGVLAIDFADDNDISSVAPSRSYDQFQVRGTCGANGVVRVISRRIGAPKR